MTRSAFMRLPIEERRQILEANCTQQMIEYYGTDREVQEWLAADLAGPEEETRE